MDTLNCNTPLSWLIASSVQLELSRAFRLKGAIPRAERCEKLGEEILQKHFPEQADELITAWECSLEERAFNLPEWEALGAKLLQES